jgi:hypothetical protein
MRIAKPSWREPISITASTYVSGFGKTATSAIDAKMMA